jgi:hypothetical protein
VRDILVVKKVKTLLFEIAYEERVEPQSPPVILLHGFPTPGCQLRAWDGHSDE